MGQYRSFDASAWERTLQTTIPKHIAKEEKAFLRNFQIGALLDAAGRVSYNNAGAGFEWDIQYRKHTLVGSTGQNVRNFTQKNLWKKAELPYRGYEATDAISKKEFLSNRGKEAVVKVYQRFVSRLRESIKQGLGPEYYVDGNASGNEQSWHGFESMFGINGTVTITTGAQRTANAADIVGYPSDTYANLSTVLGNYGGSQESGSVWPQGVASSEYDFFSPLIVNYTSTALGGASDTFAAQGDEALRYGIIQSDRNGGMGKGMTNIILARDLYTDLCNLLDGKEEVQIKSDMSLRAFGFTKTLMFDGVEVSFEHAVPETVGYGFSYNNIDLMCMNNQFIEVEGPEYDMDSSQYKVVAGTLSNLRYTTPRDFVKFDNIA